MMDALSDYHRLVEAYVRTRLELLATRYPRLALYGSGKHTAWLLALMKGWRRTHPGIHLPRVTVILDDQPGVRRLAGIPVCRAQRFNARAADAVLISSDTRAREMLAQWAALGFKQLPCIPLYENLTIAPVDKSAILAPPVPPRRTGRVAPFILFISHDASRTGAPLLLLHFLQWFRRHSRTPFRVLLKTDGPLRTDFEQLAPVHVWNGSYPHRDSIRLIYSSTATNGFLLNALARPGMPVITHAHELEYVLTHHTDRANADGILRHTTHFIAGSTAVAHYLQTAHAVAPAHISVVRDFIDRPPTFRIRARAQAQLRRELGIPADAPVVAAAGTPEWRKAPELFVVLARMVQRRRGDAPVHFIWIGGEPTGPIHGALRHDIQRAGLERLVHLVPATPRYAEYLALSDVFALLSREDCFPVVNLAAAALEKPIVCFDRSGGTPEFVERDCGYVVPYLDLETMAERILELIHQPNLRAAMGACAAQKMRRGHTVTVAGPRIKQIIDRFWRNSP